MNKKDFEEYLNGMFSVSDTLRKTEHCWAGNGMQVYTVAEITDKIN